MTPEWGRRQAARARAAGFAVRPAASGDAEDLGRVHTQVWREAYAGLMNPQFLNSVDPDRFAAHWRESLANPEDGVRNRVGLDPAGRLVGFAVAGPTRDENRAADQELFAINVVREWQGSGLAHLLFDAVAQPGPCSLWVVDGNDRAIEFYSRYGFAPDGASVGNERMGVTEVRMVRVGTLREPGAAGTG